MNEATTGEAATGRRSPIRLFVKRLASAGLAAAGLAVVAAVLAVASLPAHRGPGDPPPVPEAEQAGTIAALAPAGKGRPVVAVLALNEGTETTDFLVPYGVLVASGRAEVVAVSTHEGPVTLMPALTIRAQATTAAFDALHPEGADYVIVPAMHVADDPAVVAWIRAQAQRHATVVGICEGAWILGAAGLLDGHEAVTHWFFADRFRAAYPRARWKDDRRYVAAGRVMTTTGVSASLPASLALVEAIAGRDDAAALAKRFGLQSWDASHDSSRYRVDRAAVATAARNLLAFWKHDAVTLPLQDGLDEAALALTADAWARTLKTTVRTAAHGAREVVTRGGLTVLADEGDDAGGVAEEVPPAGDALASVLRAIEARDGEATADFVALQLEYPR